MRTLATKLLDSWDDLGIWSQYGLVVIAAWLVILAALEIVA